MNTILFVCTGNTCRSPMAEAVAQHVLDKGLLGEGVRFLPVSAGVAAGDGMPPAREAVEALRAAGIDHEGRSKPLTAEMIEGASIVFCMTASHADAARALVRGRPELEARIITLDPAGDVDDPIGHGRRAYDQMVEQFMTLVPQRLKEVLGAAPVGRPQR